MFLFFNWAHNNSHTRKWEEGTKKREVDEKGDMKKVVLTIKKLIIELFFFIFIIFPLFFGRIKDWKENKFRNAKIPIQRKTKQKNSPFENEIKKKGFFVCLLVTEQKEKRNRKSTF
jgi:hypothetical protein